MLAAVTAAPKAFSIHVVNSVEPIIIFNFIYSPCPTKPLATSHMTLSTTISCASLNTRTNTHLGSTVVYWCGNYCGIISGYCAFSPNISLAAWLWQLRNASGKHSDVRMTSFLPQPPLAKGLLWHLRWAMKNHSALLCHMTFSIPIASIQRLWCGVDVILLTLCGALRFAPLAAWPLLLLLSLLLLFVFIFICHVRGVIIGMLFLFWFCKWYGHCCWCCVCWWFRVLTLSL